MNKAINYIDINKYNTKKVNLGSGCMSKLGYLNVDLPETIYENRTKPDIEIDFTSIYFDNGSLETILFSHTLEHFQRHEAIILLIKFNHWLKLNGELYIYVPDINACIQEFISCNYERKKEIIRHAFGSHEGQWAIHCEGYFNDMLKEILTSCGFSQIEFKNISGQWPYIECISKKINKPNIDLIKNYLKDFSPNDEILLNYWLKEIQKELN
jgi:predicted SAM-dependent methyltransferase